MTIQSLAWAIDQPIPGTAGRVLIALANHADHTNGQVHFDPVTIARESVVHERSLWRYLGALERNGYLDKDDRKTPDGDKREYWLAFDRDPALPWSWAAHDLPGDDTETPVRLLETPPPSIQSSAPRAFDKSRQSEQRQVNVAEARQPGDSFPVIEGSRAHRAWCDHLRSHGQIVPFTRSMIVNGRECRGFPMPTLFPPGGDREQGSAA